MCDAGACVVALGQETAALYSDSEQLASSLLSASKVVIDLQQQFKY
jgi:leucyl aminopeptidase